MTSKLFLLFLPYCNPLVNMVRAYKVFNSKHCTSSVFEVLDIFDEFLEVVDRGLRRGADEFEAVLAHWRFFGLF